MPRNLRARMLPAGQSWTRDTPIGYLLRAATAAALIIDAVVHLQDAHFYDANTGSLLSQGQLFRIQAGVAIATAVLLLIWSRWPAWALAFVVTISAFAAVMSYTYLNIGPLAGLPGMHEPSWGPPGKLMSAYAEGIGALLALTGLARALMRERRGARQAREGSVMGTGPHQPARPSA
jgi:hypothetical protein